MDELARILPEGTPAEPTAFSLRLRDLVGLDDVVERLEQTVVQTQTNPAPVRTQSVLVEGIKGSEPDRVASALAGTLVEEGFNSFELFEPEQRHNRCHVWEPLTSHDTTHPFVLVVPSNVSRHVRAGCSENIEAYSRTDERSVVIVAATYEEGPRGRRSRYDDRAAYDVRVDVTVTEAEHRQALLRSALGEVAAEGALSLDIEDCTLERAVNSVDLLDSRLARDCARRAAMLAVDGGDHFRLTDAELEEAIEQVQSERPSKDRRSGKNREDSFEVTVPDVQFDDVGGLDQVVARVRRILAANEGSDALPGGSVAPPRGVLLYGPPGTGKSRLAAATANAADRSFLAVQGAEVKSMWFGRSEQRLREVFERAGEEAPSLVFFDEIDALAPRRAGVRHSTVQSLVSTFLTELDGIEDRDDVVVFAATNRKEAVDPALLRPGRLGTHLEVPPPDREGRQQIFAIHTREVPTAPDVTPEWFASQSPACTGAEVAAVLREALLEASARASESAEAPTVTREDVQAGIEQIDSSGEDDNQDVRQYA